MSDALNIQWYPGHMTKTRRMIEADLKLVDAVVEIVDARIPISSRNPMIDELTKGKKRLIALNKSDLSQPEGNRQWTAYFRSKGDETVELNALSGKGVPALAPALRSLLSDKIARDRARGTNPCAPWCWVFPTWANPRSSTGWQRPLRQGLPTNPA